MGRKLLYIFLILSLGAKAQSNLKYSGFFDSYYKEGPIKFSLEPCLTKMYGDLKKGGPGFGIGLGANYKIYPALYLTANFRYLSLSSKDHDAKRNASYKGSTMQLNMLAEYHFVYDLIRTQNDRRRGNKLMNAYFSTGASLNYYTSINGRTPAYHLPLILGLPIRLTPKFTIIPEIGYFMTFSDKFDGIEGVGATNFNDGYMVASFKLMFSPFDKRRKPKTTHASNGGSTGGGSGESDEFDDDGFDNLNDGFDDTDNEPIEKEEEIDNSNLYEEDSTNEEEIIEDTDDGFPEDEVIDEGDEEPQYDEDGFLIDEK